MKTREEVIEELVTILPHCSRERGGILTIDQLREAIENAEYEGEPIDVDKFLREEMSWGYCSKCRELLDGGYCELVERDYEWLEKEGDPESAQRMKAYKAKHPNCRFLCWDCLGAYEYEEQAKKEIFGETNVYDIKDLGLKELEEKCKRKLRIIEGCLKEINKEMTTRKIYKKKHRE